MMNQVRWSLPFSTEQLAFSQGLLVLLDHGIFMQILFLLPRSFNYNNMNQCTQFFSRFYQCYSQPRNEELFVFMLSPECFFHSALYSQHLQK